MKLSEKIPDATTRVAVMGLSGTGKSTLVSALASHYKLWWFTLDNDSDILFKLSQEAQDNIELFDIPDSASHPAAADTMLKLWKAGKGDICHAHGIISCAICRKNSAASSSIDFSNLSPGSDIVVIDTGSQLSHSILAHATKNEAVDFKPERDTWGALRKWTEFFCSQWQASRVNLVVIFHAVEATLEDDRVKLVPSFGSKDMSSKIAKAFSHVVYTDIKNKKHVAYSSSVYANNILTKSRTDFEIEKLDKPSLLPIFQGLIAPTKMDPVPEVATLETPGTKAVSALETMRAKLALQAKGGEVK